MFMDKYKNDNNRGNRDKKGFTLIELIVVILILGIISAVAVPKITVAMEKAEDAKFVTNINSLRLATITAYEEDAKLAGKGSGSSRNEAVAAAIAERLNLTSGPIGTYQLYTIDGIEIPSASKWYISVTNEGQVYISAEHVRKDIGEKISESLGFGKLATPEEVTANPSLKNEYIYWTSSGLAVGGHGGKQAGHLRILLHTFK